MGIAWSTRLRESRIAERSGFVMAELSLFELSGRLSSSESPSACPGRSVWQEGPNQWTYGAAWFDYWLWPEGHLIMDHNPVPSAPVFSAGQYVGVIVLGHPCQNPLFRVGFAPGDVVRSVDGEAINSPNMVNALLLALLTGPNANVDIERNGQPLTLHFRVRE